MYLVWRILLDIMKGLLLWNFDIFKHKSYQVQFPLSCIKGMILIRKIHLHSSTLTIAFA